MKKHFSLWSTALAFLGVATMTQPAYAAFTAGDMVFGVRDVNPSDSGFNNTYAIDLGTPPPGVTKVASGLNTDLTALFGANWYSNPNLQWGIIGYKALGTVITLSQAETTYGTQDAPYDNSVSGGSSARSSIIGLVGSVDTQLRNGSDVPGFTSSGAMVNGSAFTGVAQLTSDTNNWSSNLVGGNNSGTTGNSDWGFFGSAFETQGVSNTAVDMFSISGTTAGQEAYLGSYTVDSAGDVLFSSSPPIVGVPEPGRAALLGLGMVGLLLRRRRATAVA